MRLNQPPISSQPPLLIDGLPIEIVEEFKYLGSYMGSTEKDIDTRIALAWAAFAKLKLILTSRSGKPSKQLKLRLFDAACISILLYGCESWVLTAQQATKLDVFARTCYRIMLGIRQSESHMTNEQLYKEANAVPITSTIRARQLQFVGHCLRMNNDELAYTYVLNTATISSTLRREGRRRPYVDQVSAYLCPDRQVKFTANEIAAFAKDKKSWFKLVSAPHQPDR
jgi:hypothetical protein